MHISDGVLSLEVSATLAVASVAFCAYSLKKITNEKIALIASMGALFFMASFIHIPLGPTQIHLLLIGVIGLFLAELSFLSIAIALLLQALLLGYGGLSSLGANIMIMALPALLVFYMTRSSWFKRLYQKVQFFLIGFMGLFFSTLLLCLVLYFSKEDYILATYSIFIANIPAMILEGLITLFLLMYIKKSIPKLLKEVALC